MATTDNSIRITDNSTNYIFISDEKQSEIHPPYTNRGVTFDLNPLPLSNKIDQSQFFFDWFQGVIALDFDTLEPLIIGLFSPYFDNIKSSKYGHHCFKQRGWLYGFELISGSETIFSLSYGGQNAQHGCFFRITGSNARFLSSLLQGRFKDGILLVNRIDVALDLLGDFDSIVSKVLPVSQDYGMQIDQRGDWLVKDSPNGRTLYLKISNNVKLRIYEKGKEQRVKNIDLNAPLNWVRFELEITSPKGSNAKQFKSVMAGQSPFSIAISFKPYVDLLNSAFDSNLSFNRIKTTVKKAVTDYDILIENMIKQYGKGLLMAFHTEKRMAELILKIYPDSLDIPEHLKPIVSGHLIDLDYENYGEY